MSRARELLAQLADTTSFGYLGQPPGLSGDPGLGISGMHGVPRARRWDAVASVRAPDLPADEVAFVALPDGTVVVEEDVPDGTLAAVADAIEQRLSLPYRAAAIRVEGDVWSAVAQSILVAEVRDLEGDVVDLTVVAGVRELEVDGERTIRPLRALDELVAGRGDVVLHAERVDGDVFAVDRFDL